MIRRPPRSPLFPSTPLSRSLPTHITADAAFDFWYVYETVAHRGGIAAIPLNTHGHEEVPRVLSGDRKSTRLNSSHLVISYAVFCLKKKSTVNNNDYAVDLLV